MLAYAAGLAWAFIIGVIVLLGCFVGPWIRKMTPRAAMLARWPAFPSPSSRCARRSRCGKCRGSASSVCHRADRLDREHPPARRDSRRPRGGDCRRCDRLLAAAFGWSDYMKGDQVGKAFEQFGLHLPWFSADVFRGWRESRRCSLPPFRWESTTSPRR